MGDVVLHQVRFKLEILQHILDVERFAGKWQERLKKKGFYEHIIGGSGAHQ